MLGFKYRSFYFKKTPIFAPALSNGEFENGEWRICQQSNSSFIIIVFSICMVPWPSG